MANRFWIGGTGTWDAVTTTHWSATTGPGTPGASVPGAADTVTFDVNSGGGTVTVNTTVTVLSIACGAFTGTLDFSANNNNVTLSSNTGFSGTGSGTRTINLGNGTWTLTGAGTVWNCTTTTGLTFNSNSSVITLTATTAVARVFMGGGLTYNTVNISANSSGGAVTIGGVSFTAAVLNISAPNYVIFPSGVTSTITNAFTWSGSSGSEIGISTSTAGSLATISVASGSSALSWASIREIAFTGGGTFTATDSFDLGHTTGIIISAPSTGGGLAPAPIVIGRGTPY